jgi:hypothetical protein
MCAGDVDAVIEPTASAASPVAADVRPRPAAPLRSARTETTKFTIGDRIHTSDSAKGVVTALFGCNPPTRVRTQRPDGRIVSSPYEGASFITNSKDLYSLDQSDLSRAVAGVLYAEVAATIGLPDSIRLRFMFDEVHKETVRAHDCSFYLLHHISWIRAYCSAV